MNPEQTAPIGAIGSRSNRFWVHTVCHRGFLNISADEKSRQLLWNFVFFAGESGVRGYTDDNHHRSRMLVP